MSVPVMIEFADGRTERQRVIVDEAEKDVQPRLSAAAEGDEFQSGGGGVGEDAAGVAIGNVCGA
jgi:hypothetical protein